MRGLWQDVRFGARVLVRHRATTILAVVMLVLGIGANTAIFSVINGVLLQPLPLPHPERLTSVIDSAPSLGFPRFAASPANFNDWRSQNHVFSSLDAIGQDDLTVTSRGERPETLHGADVSGTFFETMGLPPVVGRFISAADDRPEAERVIVLSSDLWHRRFAADSRIVGRAITLDGNPYTVIGVAPPEITIPRGAQLWTALRLNYIKETRGGHFLRVLGRLKPGVSLQQAQTEMSAIAARLAHEYPSDDDGWGVTLVNLQDLMVEKIRPAILLLQRAVWVVLLIACANVANLLLVRVASREKELAVRSALGASSARVVRQLLAESVLMFGGSGLLGLLVGAWGTRAIVALNPDPIPRPEAIHLDGRVIVFTLGLSLLTGLLSGLAPALTGGSRRLFGVLRESGRGIAGTARSRTLRQVLVLGEVALALTLLIGAGLLIRSFARLQAVDPGFQPHGLLTAEVSLPSAKYPKVSRAVFIRDFVSRLGALPGVEHVATVDPLPLSNGQFILTFAIEGEPPVPSNQASNATIRSMTPDALSTLGLKAISGRFFTDHDVASSEPVIIVNQAFVRRYFHGQSPMGRRITFDRPSPSARWLTVVGVVGDVRGDSLRRDPVAEALVSAYQDPPSSFSVVVRSRHPEGQLGPLRKTLAAIDSDLPLDHVRTYDALIAETLAENRVRTLLIGLFGGLALLLAAIGIYGLISYSVSQRLPEIGIRIALGANRPAVLGMVVRQGMTLVVLGLGIGLLASWASSRLLADQLFQVSGADPATYAAVAVTLLVVALVANLIPARRAMRVDPVSALRSDQ
jgi:putative ABC transport system permease protein